MPSLIDALGSWDNKTFNQAMTVLEKIGKPVLKAAIRSNFMTIVLGGCFKVSGAED